MNGRESISEHVGTVCTNWSGLVIEAPVNWREGLDDRMSSGTYAFDYVSSVVCKCTYRMQRKVKYLQFGIFLQRQLE